MFAAMIQARMGSTRLPGKTLAKIGGRPLLDLLIQRVKQSSLIDKVIIATTTQARDDVLVEFAQKQDIPWFRGSEEDVLDRVYQAAKEYSVDHIVRVTPDCPLLDHKVMDRVIETYQSGNYDYVANVLKSTYPDGLDVEVFSFSALEQAWQKAQMPSQREHVTPYIRTSEEFRVFNVESPTDLSHFKWSVDTEQDLRFVRSVYQGLENKGITFDLQDVLLLLRNHPELTAINQQSVANEGYYKSLVNDPPVPAHDLPVSRSYELKDRAQALIPSCTQTFSKGPSQFVQGVAPVFLKSAKGSHVWDVDGNEYIDYAMALGPIILGHNYAAVTDAVTRQLMEGTAFSLPHPLELELAELLVDTIPCAEMVRFGKNGSDVTTGAVRAARAYTGRDIVACCGYHGWHDWFIGTTTRNLGVPRAVQELTVTFEYNNLASLEQIFQQHPGNVAAVIMEPIGVIEPQDGFLQKVQELAHAQGSVLIFDEMITGFRLALDGAQGYFGVEPDLACFGKAMANGLPLSTVVGRREIMEIFDEIFFSFTFGGETLSLAASLATINEIREQGVITHIWSQGRKLKDGFNVLAGEYGLKDVTECVGLPPRTVVTFKEADGTESLILKSLFQQECLRRGVLFTGGHDPCYSHSDQDIEHTLRVYRTALDIIAQAIGEGNASERLDGSPMEPVFRRA